MGRNGKKPSFAVDSQSPHFLHPLDSPGAITTMIKFDGKKYDPWEQAVQILRIAKNMRGFIDGTITEPTDKSSVEANTWIMVNSMIT